MKNLVLPFKGLTAEQQPRAGGKGGTLARLMQAGYPVPDGFVILPDAFDGEGLEPDIWPQVESNLERLRKGDSQIAFAVRSSALSEDSARASFAGEFETVLNVRVDEEVRESIQRVYQSRLNERVRVYSEIKGIDPSHEIAVVVQKMIPADISGVLFTADPVLGSRTRMTGNFVHGLGESLVSGEADAHGFTYTRPKGIYDGPSDLKPQARRLYDLGIKLEDELGFPQDIEWAISDGRLYLLQSRPITTLIAHNPTTGEWNDSLSGDYTWVGGGMGENLPGIMTPSTWSNWQIFIYDIAEWEVADIPSVGNICGRPYMNLSYIYSVLLKVRGKNAGQLLEPLFGALPDVNIPTVPISWRSIIFNMIPGEMRWQRKHKKLLKQIPEFISSNPGRCEELRNRIRSAEDRSELISLWMDEAKPMFMEAGLMLKASNEGYTGPWTKLSTEVQKLVGKTDSDLLMTSSGSASEQLASLGLMLGISKLANGEMTREEYMKKFGHRSQWEWHLIRPRPYEDPGWLDKQLEDFRATPVDIEDILEKRREAYEAAMKRFLESYPGKASKLKLKMDRFASLSVEREEVRSEITRVVGVVREFFLKAGELTGLGDGVFFLSHVELIQVLSGDETVAAYIPARRETHARYEALPLYPGVINGRFDPFQWASDPNRRIDVFDSHAPVSEIKDVNMITGNPGSGGRVEGIVRIINSPEDGDQLNPGEILVTTTTNVGWTPLFPKASAVITDIGMPLAHAAIVARELGIPAVVGCGIATMRLKSGDRVRVDGGLGTVEILDNT